MRTALLALLAAAVLALPGTAAARVLKFITIDTAPWAFIDPASGRPDGAFPAVVRELERRTGHTIEISLHPFARIDQELEFGGQDCTIIVWSDSRERIVVKGESIYPQVFGVVARAGVTLKSYDDLRPLTISVLRGLAIDPRFDGDAGLRKDFDKDYLSGIRKIAHNRLDAIAGAVPKIYKLAEQEGLADRLGEHIVLRQIPLALQCSRKSANLDVMPQLDAALRAMREDGTLERIKVENHYF